MKMNKIIAAIAATIFSLGGAQSAIAACVQADAAGSWQAYSIAANSAGGYWVRCRLSIGTTGIIAATPCTNSAGNTGNITNGRVSLSDASRCTFTGSFTLGGVTNLIRHSTMSKDKITVEGVGTFPGGIFSFNLTKL